MKKFLFTLLLLIPGIAIAQFTVPQGGTGTTTFPTNWVVIGNSSLRLTAVSTSSLGLTATFGTTSISALFPIIWNTSLAQLSFGGLSTSSPFVIGQPTYVTTSNTIASTPTTSVSCVGTASCSPFVVFGSSPFTITGAPASTIGTTTGLSIGQGAYFTSINPTILSGFSTTSVTCSGGTSCTGFNVLGASPITITSTALTFGTTSISATYPLIWNTSTANMSTALVTTTSQTWGGTQTFTNSPVFSTLGAGTVNSTAAGTIYNTATSTPSVTSPITYSGTLGQFIGGASGAFGCASCVTVSTATSTITGTTGQVVYMQGTNSPIGTSTIFIAGNSTVGISTTTPVAGQALTIGGNIWQEAGGSVTNVLQADDSGGGGSYARFELTTGGGRNVNFGTECAGGGCLVIGSSPYAGIMSTDAAYPLQFGTSGTLRATITPTGNVGIGDATPAALLTVGNGDVFQVLSTGEARTTDGSVGTPSFSFTSDTDTGVWRRGSNNLAVSTGGVQAINVDSSQRVQIGTTSPYGQVFTIAANSTDGSASGLVIQNGGADANNFDNRNFQLFQGGTSSALPIWNNAGVLEGEASGGLYVGAYNGPVVFAAGLTARTERMRITPGGLVGIASSTPWRTLAVTGTVGFDGLTGSAGLQVGILCLSANKEVINESVACVASSERFKQDIKPLTVGLDEVLKLKPISYEWKPSFNGALQTNPNYSGTQYGLIAESVQKVDPNLITVETSTSTFDGSPAGTVHGLQEANHFIALLVKSIQEIESQVLGVIHHQSDQDKEIELLKQQVKDLQTQMGTRP